MKYKPRKSAYELGLPITLDREKKCLFQDGKEYPLTLYNLNIYKKHFNGSDNLNELSTVVLDI